MQTEIIENEVLKRYKVKLDLSKNDLIYLLQKNYEEKNENPKKVLKSAKYDPESHNFLFQRILKRFI